MNTHRNHDYQVKKDLRTLRRISVLGIILVFGGLLLLTGFAQSKEFGEYFPNWAVVLAVFLISIGFTLANLLPILRFFFNRKENARVKNNIRKEAKRCQKDFDDNIEFIGTLFVGAMLCLMIMIFI